METLELLHEAAFGFGISDLELKGFIERTNSALQDYDFTTKYLVDFIYKPYNIPSSDVLSIASYKCLWGQGISEPYVAIENIRLTANNFQILKETTLKITLENGLELIKFKVLKDELELLDPKEGYVDITVIGQCSINTWMGKMTPQILITDYEINRSVNYYF